MCWSLTGSVGARKWLNHTAPPCVCGSPFILFPSLNGEEKGPAAKRWE